MTMKYNNHKHGRTSYGSWVQISKEYWDALEQEPSSNIDLDEQMFAQMVHVTNPCTFTLSGGDINLGQVEVKDGGSELLMDVISTGGVNAIPIIALEPDGSLVDFNLYHDGIASAQLTLHAVNEQAVTALTGKGTVKMRISSGGTAYIGGTGLTSSDGYLIDDANPVEEMTVEDLRKVFVIGSGTLYILISRIE